MGMGKTIQELLAEGRERMEERARKEREAMEAEAQQALKHWNALVATVRLDLGDELADTAVDPVVADRPPPHFRQGEYRYEVVVRPFGAGRIRYCFRFAASQWAMSNFDRAIFGGHEARVEVNYQVSRWLDEDTGRKVAGVNHLSFRVVSSLAEAVALCANQTDAYREAEAEAKRINESE